MTEHIEVLFDELAPQRLTDAFTRFFEFSNPDYQNNPDYVVKFDLTKDSYDIAWKRMVSDRRIQHFQITGDIHTHKINFPFTLHTTRAWSIRGEETLSVESIEFIIPDDLNENILISYPYEALLAASNRYALHCSNIRGSFILMDIPFTAEKTQSLRRGFLMFLNDVNQAHASKARVTIMAV